ncbi:transposase (fragment) [Xenorhabdus bovienii str. Intermedium]|uniref:Mutator family transposase n=1 Tax=Xenorhabdus bovienii str. Intermedium TaxID=1379677 RepID=A0A077QM71_XENBV
MDEKQLQALATELANNLKALEDLSQLSRFLKKLTVETALKTELAAHLSHEKHPPKSGPNTRNGYSSKTLLTEEGELALQIPRDREITFEPQIVRKNQTRIAGMDSQILALYARGMTTRDIAGAFKELYDADVSPSLIAKVTDAVKAEVIEWQSRPLGSLYPIVYLDCRVVKMRQDNQIINKSVFIALGINTEGH